MSQKHEQWLKELTSLPTAAGREGAVVGWVERWVARRRSLEVVRDRYGNLLVQRRDVGEGAAPPIVITAHMDHPAFVVTRVEGERVRAEFRGGVAPWYFDGTPVTLWRDGERAGRGKVIAVDADEATREIEADLKLSGDAEAGDVVTWDLPPATVEDGLLHAPACDDLAGVAAAVSALDVLSGKRLLGRIDLRVLLTRAEEVGFVGAIAACKSKLLPRRARVVALEASKSFAESPIGGGPIVRVGDRTSTFDPGLTHAVGVVAQRIADGDDAFIWQRKLMPGGTCEATAYQAFGHTATCVCLPLGNYHNMDEAAGQIAPEVISLADFHGLVRLLAALASPAGGLDDADATPPLKDRLSRRFEAWKRVL